VFVGRFHCLDKQGNLILFDTYEFAPRRHFPSKPAVPPPNGSASSLKLAGRPETSGGTRDPSAGPHRGVAGGQRPAGGSRTARAYLELPQRPGDASEQRVVTRQWGAARAATPLLGKAPGRKPPSEEDPGEQPEGASADPLLGGTMPVDSSSGPPTTVSLLPPAPVHPVLQVQPGARTGKAGRGEEGGAGGARVGRAAASGPGAQFPVHARVSCQLECELDEDLSFLSLSDPS